MTTDYGEPTTQVDLKLNPRAYSGLNTVFNTARSVEKCRIQMGNRTAMIRSLADPDNDDVVNVYEKLHVRLLEIEEQLVALAVRELRHFPVWDTWLSHVKGIGPSLGSQLLALLLPPLPERGPSTWYKAAGLVPELRADEAHPDGIYRLPRPRAGEGAITYHPWLRRCLNNVAESFVRLGGYYREVYDNRKARLRHEHRVAWVPPTPEEEGHWKATDPDWPLLRVDRVARWMTIRFFLSHLYEMWLEADGHAVSRRAYVVDHLGHAYVPPPRWAKGQPKI